MPKTAKSSSLGSLISRYPVTQNAPSVCNPARPNSPAGQQHGTAPHRRRRPSSRPAGPPGGGTPSWGSLIGPGVQRAGSGAAAALAGAAAGTAAARPRAPLRPPAAGRCRPLARPGRYPPRSCSPAGSHCPARPSSATPSPLPPALTSIPGRR